MQELSVVSTYAALKQSVDNTNPDSQKDAATINEVESSLRAELAFIENEIIALDEGTVNQYMEEEKELQSFSKYIQDIRKKKQYALNRETEEILAALGSVSNSPYTIYSRAKLSDMVFDSFKDENGQEMPLSFALYDGKYSYSPSIVVRRNSFDSFIRTLKQYKNTIAATYASQVDQEVTIAKKRGYDSATDMLLQSQQVTEEMYENQLDIIMKELAPHMRKYAELKKRILKLDKMTLADLKAPLDSDFNLETSYEEAAETVEEALKIMGPEYSEIIQTAFSNRWIDYADNVGKFTEAFCSIPTGVHPYVLMTWPGTMRGAFTLAHELGHAGHFYLFGKNQRFTNVKPSRYFIEAPSTMNEMLLSHYLLNKHKDKRTRRWVILQLLGTYYHNFVTHLHEGELQRRVYKLVEEGEPLTADVLSEQQRNILEEFWGDTVEIDEGASLTWMRQPHYYMGLYPYTYSAGLTVSTIASKAIFEEGQPAVDRWLDVLKSGGTLAPLELIKKANVDMSNPDPIKEAVVYVGSLIDEVEESYQ